MTKCFCRHHLVMSKPNAVIITSEHLSTFLSHFSFAFKWLIYSTPPATLSSILLHFLIFLFFFFIHIVDKCRRHFLFLSVCCSIYTICLSLFHDRLNVRGGGAATSYFGGMTLQPALAGEVKWSQLHE